MKFHNLRSWSDVKAPNDLMDFHPVQETSSLSVIAFLYACTWEFTKSPKYSKKTRMYISIKFVYCLFFASVRKKSYNTNVTNHMAFQQMAFAGHIPHCWSLEDSVTLT